MTPLPLTVSLAVFMSAAAVWAQGIVINEFVAENRGGLRDEDGDSSDWIELRNLSSTPINLAGYTLTDDADLPNKWVMPDRELAGGGFLIVFASGKDRKALDAPLHANFSLDEGGEYLALLAPGTTTPHSVFAPFPEQRTDVAYGRGSGGEVPEGYLLQPTPNESNGEAILGFVRDTKFEPNHGFYSEAVTVALTTATPGATIRYTLDQTEPTLTNGMTYTEPVLIEHTTILRVAAFKENYASSDVDTQSYLYPADIKNQFVMDARVVAHPDYRDEMESALGNTLPCMSLLVPNDGFFGPDGIHTLVSLQGRSAEVPISVEYFNPQDVTDRFRLRAGIRIHGGNARFHPKKPFRLYFREDYGTGRLRHPLFEGSPVDSFKQLVLRGGGHDGWALADRFEATPDDIPPHASFLRDQFLRKTETDLGMLSPLGKYIHLYINGSYWGIYDLHERPNADYFSDHLGGDDDEWDVLHHPEFEDELHAVVNGNDEDWLELMRLSQSQVSSEKDLQRMEKFINLDHFTDSMIIRMWSGDYDWLGPIYLPRSPSPDAVFDNVTSFQNKNWYASKRRGDDTEKFRFFTWDGEMSMGLHLMFNIFQAPRPQREINFDLSAVNDPGTPAAIYDSLIRYPPYRRYFADRLQKHLFNGGVLSPEKTQPRMQALVDDLDSPIIAESARWGNTAIDGTLLTRNDHWRPEVEWLVNAFLIGRAERMLNGFRDTGIYPDTPAPEFNQHGGFVDKGQMITLSTTNPDDRIYYTLDGSDPARPPITDVTQVLPLNAECVYLVPSLTNGAFNSRFRWTSVDGYSAPALWAVGRTGLGYEIDTTDYKGEFQTDVGPVLRGSNTSIYVRIGFSMPTQSQIDDADRILLKMKYDDGFIAYVNDNFATSSNAPEVANGNSSSLFARPDTDAIVEQTFNITSIRNVLRPGRNMLAIHGLNNLPDSSDFLLAPRIEMVEEISQGEPSRRAKVYREDIALEESTTIKARVRNSTGEWSPLTEAYFFVEPKLRPGDLALSEIHYRPAPPSTEEELEVTGNRNAFEFVELVNTRDTPLPIGGASFTQGIRFTFPSMTLAPGEMLVLVRHREAFVARYGDAIAIAGEFAQDTKLSDMGERLTLRSSEGEVILSVRYEDAAPWPEMADGDGKSLLFRGESGSDPNDPANWTASIERHGHPGISGLTTYGAWRAHHFPRNARDKVAGPEADPDGDSLINLLEYVFGSPPNHPGEEVAYGAFQAENFQFVRRPAMEDITFEVEWSNDLIDWQSVIVDDDNTLVEGNDSGRESVAMEIPDSSVSRFGRLKVTLAP